MSIVRASLSVLVPFLFAFGGDVQGDLGDGALPLTLPADAGQSPKAPSACLEGAPDKTVVISSGVEAALLESPTSDNGYGGVPLWSQKHDCPRWVVDLKLMPQAATLQGKHYRFVVDEQIMNYWSAPVNVTTKSACEGWSRYLGVYQPNGSGKWEWVGGGYRESEWKNGKCDVHEHQGYVAFANSWLPDKTGNKPIVFRAVVGTWRPKPYMTILNFSEL